MDGITGDSLEAVVPGRVITVFGESLHHGIISKTAQNALVKVCAAPRLRGHMTDQGQVTEEYAFHAFGFASEALPLADLDQAIRRDLAARLRTGVTTVHELCPSTYAHFLALLRVRASWCHGAFPVTRVYLRPTELERCANEFNRLKLDGLLTQGELGTFVGLKLFADGTFGAHTAHLGRAYSDTFVFGDAFDQPTEVLRYMRAAGAVGVRELAIHAIGDAGIWDALRFADMWKRMGDMYGLDVITRIEHFELPLPRPDVLETVARAEVTVVMQPSFLEDVSYVDRLDDRVRDLCPHKSVLESGIPLMLGTDDLPPSMLYALHKAVTAPLDHQRLTLAQALHAATRSVGHFTGSQSGRLCIGAPADFVQLETSAENRLLDEGLTDRECDALVLRTFKSGIAIT